MPILYEDTDTAIRYHANRLGKTLKLSPSPSLAGYLIVFGLGAVVGGILVYGPTRSALIHAVAKGAGVAAEKVETWAAR
jgi:hypothetical protein